MLYSILKFLSTLTLKGYFRQFKIDGEENIPKEGPFIFVANHPSAFMDPIVVASVVKPSLHFIAAGEYVGKGVKGWIFKRFFHMIPVFRPSTRPGETHKNEDMFKQCHEHLLNGGSLLIFPEGVSLTERKLKPLKTGTVRIIIGAEELSQFKQDIPIIPIGLNYSDPHTFRSDLYVKIGEPLYRKDFVSAEELETKEAQIDWTKKITAILQDRMEELVLHIEHPEEEEMLEHLAEIYQDDLQKERGTDTDDPTAEFELQKEFSEAIAYFKRNRPVAYGEIEKRINTYVDRLEEHELSDKEINEVFRQLTNRRVGYFIGGAPFFAAGFVTNYVPYRLTGWITDRIPMDKTFSGSIRFASGLVTFLIWYVGVSVLLGVTLIGLWALLVPVAMYILGTYALVYAYAYQHGEQRKHLRQIAREKPELIAELRAERKEIISTLATFQEEWSEN